MSASVSRVVVLGASGFVGSAVMTALKSRGANAVALAAPRLPPMTASRAGTATTDHQDVVVALTGAFHGAQAVVNAAGVSDSGHSDMATLVAANSAVPAVAAAAAKRAGVRFVHVSSAAVQGRVRCLDASERTAPFSVYSQSKALGEHLVLREGGQAVVYRPPGVHGHDRRATRSIVRLAASPLASVARPGTANTAQALIENVADAIAFLSLTTDIPPAVVAHPTERLTTAELMRLLGGKEPFRLPRWIARSVVVTAFAVGRRSPRVTANARRLEMLWLGQDQAGSWLEQVGWSAPAGRVRWTELGDTLRTTSFEKRTA